MTWYVAGRIAGCQATTLARRQAECEAREVGAIDAAALGPFTK